MDQKLQNQSTFWLISIFFDWFHPFLIDTNHFWLILAIFDAFQPFVDCNFLLVKIEWVDIIQTCFNQICRNDVKSDDKFGLKKVNKKTIRIWFQSKFYSRSIQWPKLKTVIYVWQRGSQKPSNLRDVINVYLFNQIFTLSLGISFLIGNP